MPILYRRPDGIAVEGNMAFGGRGDFYRPIYDALLQQLGPSGWWPADTDFEIIVGAILTQNTSWKNVEKALESLSSHGLLSARAMARVPAHELAPLIRTSGYYNQKARKLTAFLKWFVKHNYSTAALRKRYAPDPLLLRAELLGLFGIGPETADSILNYALGFPFFVVDAYTHRLVERYGPHRSRQKYEIVRADVESEFTAVYGTKQLPQHLGEFHALIVRHGNSVCVKRAPRCGSCSLAGSCAFPV